MRKKRHINQPLISEKKIRKKRQTTQDNQKIEINIGKLISEYLIHSYLYYEKQKQVISDQDFDEIVYKLTQNFDEIKNSNHIHKNLIDKTALEGFTGFHLIKKFPNIVKICALELLDPKKKINELIKEI